MAELERKDETWFKKLTNTLEEHTETVIGGVEKGILTVAPKLSTVKIHKTAAAQDMTTTELKTE